MRHKCIVAFSLAEFVDSQVSLLYTLGILKNTPFESVFNIFNTYRRVAIFGLVFSLVLPIYLLTPTYSAAVSDLNSDQSNSGMVVIYPTADSYFITPTHNSATNLPVAITGLSTSNQVLSKVELYFSPALANTWSLIDVVSIPVPGSYFNWQYSWSPAQSGIYDLMAKTYDRDNNLNSTASVDQVTYDVLDPTVNISQPSNNAFMFDGSVVAGIVDDHYFGNPSVKIQFRSLLDNSLITELPIITQVFSNAFSLAISEHNTDANYVPAGRYNLVPIVTDRAGNQNSSNLVSNITVDYMMPNTTINQPGNNALTNSSVLIKGLTLDDASTARVELAIRTAGANDWKSLITLDNTALSADFNWQYNWTPSVNGYVDGYYDIRAQATDAAGRQEHTAIVNNLTYDATGPVISGQEFLFNGQPVSKLIVGQNITVRVNITDMLPITEWHSEIINANNGKSFGNVVLYPQGNDKFTGTFEIPTHYTDGTVVVADENVNWQFTAKDLLGNVGLATSAFQLGVNSTPTTPTTPTTPAAPDSNNLSPSGNTGDSTVVADDTTVAPDNTNTTTTTTNITTTSAAVQDTLTTNEGTTDESTTFSNLPNFDSGAAVLGATTTRDRQFNWWWLLLLLIPAYYYWRRRVKQHTQVV